MRKCKDSPKEGFFIMGDKTINHNQGFQLIKPCPAQHVQDAVQTIDQRCERIQNSQKLLEEIFLQQNVNQSRYRTWKARKDFVGA